MSTNLLTPTIGQRWISDTETELGLGVLVEIDGRSLTILFPKSEETRVYARSNAPLSRIRFSVGDTIQDVTGNSWLITQVNEKNGLVKYQVINDAQETSELNETRLSADIHLSRPQERLLASQLDSNELFNLRVQALLQKERASQLSVRGLVGPRLGKVPHQFYIAQEVGNRPQPRVLLGDEVGLGKTIEAGLIIHQQLQTGRSQRILILVPENLQYQWLVEMRRRFNLNVALFDLERTAALREADAEQNPFETEQIVLMALELLVDHPDLAEAAIKANWDLLVVDEAHHLEWEPESPSAAYELVSMLTEKINGVLLLTATPEHLGIESHFARLKLLDPARYHDLEAFLTEENNFSSIANVADELLSDKPVSTNAIALLKEKLGNDLPNALESAEQRQSVLTALLDRHGIGRVLFRNTREAIGGFPERQCFPVPVQAPSHYQPTTLAQSLYPEMHTDDEEWCSHDPRVEWLLSLLKKLKREKVLLICRSSPVALALEEHLRLKEGIRTSVFHEAMSLLERDRAAAYFADAEYGAQIMLCSEIGSEGRNFQFAHHLVLFDLPADPELLEQRIGRLDRIGQTQTIHVHIPFYEGTAQERLFRWYHEGLNAVEHISPTARHILDALKPEFPPALREGGEKFEQLIQKAKELRQVLMAELEKGRDRLIELNSCRRDVAQQLMQTIANEDAANTLPDFMERVWSAFGVEQEEQPEAHLNIIRPGNHQLLDGFPALDPEGMTVSFNRDYALAREDVHFLTWEHPMAQGVLDLFLTQEFGNANIAIIRNKGIKAGTLLVEIFFRLETIAPKGLNIDSALPSLVQRVLLDHEGRLLSDRVSHEVLVKQVQHMDKSLARQILKSQQSLIESLLQKAQKQAESQLPAVRDAALNKWQVQNQQEIDRLKALAAVNPAVRPAEIAILEKRLAEGTAALKNLKLVAHAVRLIVAG